VYPIRGKVVHTFVKQSVINAGIFFKEISAVGETLCKNLNPITTLVLHGLVVFMIVN